MIYFVITLHNGEVAEFADSENASIEVYDYMLRKGFDELDAGDAMLWCEDATQGDKLNGDDFTVEVVSR